MTHLRLYRKIRSLVWRRNITESLEKLESEIKNYMFEKGTDEMVIAGYSLKLVAGKLLLKKLPVINIRQLQFSFLKKKGDVCVVHDKNAEKLGGFGGCVSQEQGLHG